MLKFRFANKLSRKSLCLTRSYLENTSSVGAYFLNPGLLEVLLYFQRRQWHPTPVLLPGKSHGWRSLVGCSPWGRWELDTAERLHFHFSLSCIGEGNGKPLQCSCLENPRDGEPGGLPSMGSHRVGLDWSDSAAAAAACHSRNLAINFCWWTFQYLQYSSQVWLSILSMDLEEDLKVLDYV